ncbi:YfhO family protein [Lactobacillus halodurans]|uniref:YfhO family protein n=1 Tax=Companilactobacillus halodurans TaxID=2584183 RepID=A0A5P0ZNX0_9LACO|nr:YfhO family protein [Companilactobacillus halodurans]MQS75882.1 YfhO family protein [Companilactobacillus halodurans]
MIKRRLPYYFGAFFINLIIISIIFAASQLVPFGSNNFLSSDLGTQYLAFLTELRRQLVSGNVHLYLFSQSLGDNFFPVISYYLLSPFNLLLVLFSPKGIPAAANIIIMLKISTMGVSMAYFLTSYFKKRGMANYLFTIAYSFCGFVASYFYDLMWLDALIMLPLVAVGVMLVIKQQKYILYYCSILLAIIFNYYLGYMLCIFSVCFFVYIALEEKLFQRKIKWHIIRNYLMTSILAGLSSAVVLIPTLVGMLKTAKTSFNLFNYLPSARFGLEALTELGIGGNTFQQRLEHGPSVFMTTLILILLLSYFFSSKISNQDKAHSLILLGVLLVSMFVTTFNTVWHMFQNPAGFPFRNSFIFSFVCIFIAYKAFDKGVFQESDTIIKSTCVAGILICLGYSTEWLLPRIIEKLGFDRPDNPYDGRYFWLSIACIVISGTLLLLLNRNQKFLSLMLIMVAFEVIANFNAVMGTAGLGNQLVYRSEFAKENNILKDVKNQSHKGQRIIVSKSGLNKAFPEKYNNYNDPILFNINGLSLYSSTLDQNTLEMMHNLGYFSLNVRRISYYGGTNLTNALLGVYYRVRQWDNHYHVEENYNAPSMGFLVDPDVYNFKMYQKRAFSNQDRLWQALNGNSQEYLKNVIINSMQQTEFNNKTLYTYQLSTRASGPLYFYVSPMNYVKARIYVNGKRIKTADKNVYSAASIRLGHFKNKQKIQVKILTDKALDVDPDYFQSLDQTSFLKTLQKFRQNSLQISSDLNHDTVRGTISVKNKSPMLFSIPYDDGWQASVDGKKVKIHKVVENLMAINLKPGKHQVVLNYQVPGLKLGWIVSGISVILFISFSLLEKSKYWKNKSKE